MPDVISFQDAINATQGDDKALLIGNGFSAQYFNYANLLAEAKLDEGSPIKELFDQLGTVDFEAVIRAVEDASVVERAYGNDDHAEQLIADAQTVREALVTAVNATHPAHREDLDFQYESAAAFLKHFSKGQVFTLNYDLLLYWVNLEKGLLTDGFGLGDYSEDGRFKGPFVEGAYCRTFNLHGGLHLFQNEIGEVYKALNDGDGVIANITHEIANNGRLPLYVAEGTSTSKLRKINSVEYLRHCYHTLQETTAAVFIFGHSADPNDAHIYHAIFGSKAKHVYFGLFQPNEEKVTALDAELAKYKKLGGDDVPYSFFDSETAHVWDGSSVE
ncbi:hypothetical protein B6V73_05670 [Thioclava sp. JM3]|uniref:DUF4917 family protein n=1 Tax=Thioclava sp. JM3 TaxID=1973004 RepID=UPI000B53E1CC|nr:DUF4917 family protein [Thioclava sp. JM3]OWY18096.1 hypothetical protein B6V73_05670 [Thioclava sp. JM3]